LAAASDIRRNVDISRDERNGPAREQLEARGLADVGETAESIVVTGDPAGAGECRCDIDCRAHQRMLRHSLRRGVRHQMIFVGSEFTPMMLDTLML